MALHQTQISESLEQQFLFRWATFASGKYPELDLLYHIPNEGLRTKATGGRLKAEGLKSGVPDICLPVSRGKYHGLYIELKRENGGTVSTKQREWLDNLFLQGYCAIICHGWEAAKDDIEEYLNLRKGDKNEN